MQIISRENFNTDIIFAKQFLGVSPKERIFLIKDIIESKNKMHTLSLLNGIEKILYKKTNFTSLNKESQISFDVLQTVRAYITDRSASVKMLLEYLSVSLPVCTTSDTA